MKTEELIAHLASRAVPVRPLPSPAIRVIAWSAVAIASAAVGIAAFGARSDLGVMMSEPQFMWSAIVALATASFAVAGALVLAVPGAPRTPALRGAAVALMGGWATMGVIAVVRGGLGFAAASDGHWLICFVRVLAIGLVPVVVLFGMLRRAAPLRLTWTGALAFTAAMATGALAIQFICPLNDPAHALFGHFGPVLAMAGLGAGAAQRLLKRPIEPLVRPANR